MLPHRLGSSIDVLIDWCGISLGVLVWYGIRLGGKDGGRLTPARWRQHLNGKTGKTDATPLPNR